MSFGFTEYDPGEEPGIAFPLAPLFDLIPNAYLFVKDREGRFLKGNRALLKMMGLRSETELLGKTDFDFFPHDLACEYRVEDLQVMNTRVPVVNRPWLVCDATGKMDWFVSSKLPLLVAGASSAHGATVLGIAGMMRDLQEAGRALKPYQEMQAVLDAIFRRYPEAIRNSELAKLVHLSVSQFNRKFKELFKTSPQCFIHEVRLRMAKRLLVTSDKPVSAIAHETGFYDQSCFSKRFRTLMGQSPGEYRKRHRHLDPMDERLF